MIKNFSSSCFVSKPILQYWFFVAYATVFILHFLYHIKYHLQMIIFIKNVNTNYYKCISVTGKS